MCRVLGGVLAAVGFFVFLCTIGASDADLIGWDRLLLQLDVAVMIIAAGGVLIHIDDVRQRSGRRRKKHTKAPGLSCSESHPPLSEGPRKKHTERQVK